MADFAEKTKYVIDENAVHVTVCGEHIVIVTSEPFKGEGLVQAMNAEGGMLWDVLAENTDEEYAVPECVRRYGWSEDEALTSYRDFTSQLIDAGYMVRAEKK